LALAIPCLAWTYLIIAGLMEPCWVIGLKRSEGLKRLGWSAVTIGFVLASMYFLASAMAMGLPMGTAYAVWVGIGTVGSLGVGMMLFNEPHDLVRLFFMLLIVIGIAGAQATGKWVNPFRACARRTARAPSPPTRPGPSTPTPQG